MDRYCTKCNIYLCSKCKSSHKDPDINNLDNNTDEKIKEIKESIKKCEYNLYLNNNFDLKSLQIYQGECLSNTFNKLISFYNNKNHIRTREYAEHFITEKYCGKIIKKCIFINPKLIAIMFNYDNQIYYIHNNENNYQTKFICYYKLYSNPTETSIFLRD